MGPTALNDAKPNFGVLRTLAIRFIRNLFSF